MKKTNVARRDFLMLAGVAGLALAGCGSPRNSESEPKVEEESEAAVAPESEEIIEESSAAETPAASSKGLIVLWSWSGNTLKMAERLSELSGASVHRLEAVDPYPEDYDQTADRAKQERDDGVYPEIANPVEGWDAYDTIYLGYPIWWYTLPMIVQGFVRDHDWTGKTIVPFNSHEGSGDGGTYDDLRDMTGATVLDGLAIRGGDVASSLDQVDAWYAGLNA